MHAGSLEYVSVVKTSTAAGRLNAGSLKDKIVYREYQSINNQTLECSDAFSIFIGSTTKL